MKPEHRLKISLALKGKPKSHEHKMKAGKASGLSRLGKPSNYLGKLHTEETKNKISESRKGKTAGENHHKWKPDRTKLAKRQERNDSSYKEWRRLVWLRDNFKCKIANPDCAGQLEAHHILGWSEYPELRYKINNGITLCHAHHPRRRAEEKRLSPYFLELVSVSK